MDYRSSSEGFAKRLNRLAPVIALDEGGVGRSLYAYIIDILPTLASSSIANEQNIGYLDLPPLSRQVRPSADGLRILISFGGSDQSRMTELIGNF